MTLEIRKTVYIRTVILQLDGYLILNRVIDFFCVCFKTSGIKFVIYFYMFDLILLREYKNASKLKVEFPLK